MKKLLLFIGFLFSFFIGFGQCPTDSILLISQAEVNDFAIEYPGCNIIQGTLRISGSDILDLTPLNTITIVGNLEIINNDILHDLDGLNELFELEQLTIEGNDALEDLSGLNSLENLNTLEIINNQSLEDLSGLNGLSTIGNSISITNNSNLMSLQGLQNLNNFENSGGVLSITDNINLSNISALNSFSLYEPYEAVITGNSSLSSCDIVSFCEIIMSNIEITIENNGVDCNSVEEVALNCSPCQPYIITLYSQAEVDSFPIVYGACTDILLNEVIISGPDIVDLTPLSSFTFVSGHLKIINNEQLTSLEGFNNFSFVNILEIGNNPQLSDITSISNGLNNDEFFILIIKDNPLLETCSFAAMCNFIDIHIGLGPYIENNGEQCMTLGEVIENCETSTNLISGTILFDFNNDGCDIDDYNLGNTLVQTTNGSETRISITDDEGNFSLFVDEGIYTTSILSESLPNIFQGTPESIESVFTGLGNEEIINFCVETIEAVSDNAITLVPLQEPRPGFNATYVISYSNLGSVEENGIITMNFDDESVSYVDAEISPNAITDTFLTWEYNNLQPFETRAFQVIFEVFAPPILIEGEILSSDVSITTMNEDDVPENNISLLRELVVNSYDPNDKQVLQGEQILEEEVGDYLDYVVRFQNTGTADAINVVVTDTLSDNLNWNTLRILSSSDDYRLEITNENEVAFIFENINLPPEEEDEEGSNGHIAFQIRSNDDLVLGDVIENTANIFFDFNAPIITNTVVTTVSEPCPLGITLTSQAEVNAFPINYPTCTEIDGQLIIEGDDITDLSPLSGVTSVIEGIIIRNNTNLITLAGLGITQIGGRIQIVNNPSLENLQGLEGLTSMEDDLEIRDNASLLSLSGLNNLTQTDDLSIINNDSLEDLVGLGALSFTDGDLSIEDNDSLENLGGLMNYSGGDALSIVNNIALTSMDGLGAFNTLAIHIINNPSLIDIISLNQVENIGEILEIVNNDNLTSLEGLQNLNTIHFGFTLSGNEMLTDITALSELLDPSMYIVITNNPNLSICDIDVVCSFISNLEPSQDVLITNNATDCNSVEEVEEQCLLGIEEEFLESGIKLYPNPTTRILNITFPSEIELQTIDVFSVTGKKVYTTQDVTIDFSSLAKGMYFARITTSKGVITKKIVKK